MKSRWGNALVLTLGLVLLIARLAPGETAQAQREPAPTGSNLDPERNGTEHGFQSINLEGFGVSQYFNDVTQSLSQLSDLDFADEEPNLNIYPVGDPIGLVADNSSGDYWVIRYEVFEAGSNSPRALTIERVAATSDGGFIALASAGSSSDRVDAVIKADTNGALQWTRQFNRVGLRNIVESSDGYIAVGTNIRGAFNVISLDYGGAVKWQRELKRQNITNVFPVEIRPNGNIIIGGYSYKNNFPFTSPTGSWVVELDASGDSVVWENTTVLGIWNDKGIRSIQLLPNGNLIYGAGFSSGYYDKALLGRIQSDGTLGWTRIWPEAGVNAVEARIASSIEITNDGVLLAGSITDLDGVGNDIWFIKVDQNGNLLNQFQVGGAKNEIMFDMRLLPNGNIIVLAGTDSFYEWSQARWLFEVTEGGQFVWGKVYEDTDFNRLDVTPQGDLILSSRDNTVFKIKPNAEIDNCNVLSPSSAPGLVDFEILDHSDVSLQWEAPSMTLNELTLATSIPNVTPSGVCGSSYSITGKITVQDSTALQGVTVSAGAKSATTDSGGNYTISGLTTGTYTIMPSLSGYTFTPASRSVAVPPNGTAADFIATPEGGVYSISGKVTMQNGTPLQGVTVSTGSKSTITNANGNYTISGLSAGMHHVSAAQSGFTFAPVDVSVPPSKDNVNLGGVSEYDYDTGFRPQPHGYGFSNGDPGWGKYPNHPADGDFTFLDMQNMFGDNVVCRQPDPSGGACISYKLGPALWNRTVNTMISTGGRCVGMSSTSLLYFDNSTLLPPSYNATNDVPLAVGRRPIAYYAAEQLADPVRSHFREQQGQSTPTGTLDQLKQAIESNNPVILNLRQNFAGHAVTPYALDDRGEGIWRVMVYDNNDHNNANLFVEIDENADRWRYDPLGWEGLRWTHSLYVTSLSLFTGTQSLPFRTYDSRELVGSVQDPQTNQLYLMGEGHLLITDSQGNQIGFQGDDFINDIPGASAVTFFGGLNPVEPVYELPVNEPYTIQVDSLSDQRSAKQIDVAQFGEGYGLSIRNMTLNSTSGDELIFAPDGSGLTYKANSSSSQPDMVVAIDKATTSYQLEILGADVGAGQTVSVQADLVDKWLIFDSENAKGGAYNLAMTIVDTSMEHQFNYENIQMSSGDTHYIDFLELEAGGPVYLGIDIGSDGTIDDYFELEEPSSGGIYLPVILRPSSTPSQPPLSFVYPQNGQTLTYEGDYLFKVVPYPNAEGYLWGFFQNGQYVWENMTEEGTLDGPEYAILSGTEAHNRFRRGAVDVWVRASSNNGNWTEPTIITIFLE